ncbi:MAG: RagB/SusD family nutrient uptake outer membrane protein [Bacteroidaceae bacterium]|nr:RagB/SusD family nutrient uptake outer membrane protein [Bacteroidaceae bacterium]
MKKLYIILATIALASCNTFLTEEPKDQEVEDMAYQDGSSVYLNAVATLYNYIGGNTQSQGLQGTYRGVYDFNTFTTDEAIIPTRGGDWYDGGFWQEIFLHEWDAGTGALNDTWKYLYKVIALCNRSIETLDSHASLLSSDELIAYKAEVRALRAMYYYYLMDMFARVPLVLSSSTPMSQVKQSSRPEVFQFVLSELQETLPLLAYERSNHLGDYYGRMTEPVALFLLAKICLNAEVYCDENWTDGVRTPGNELKIKVEGKEMNAWEACIAYCEELAYYGYKLEESMENCFAVHNETSAENIFTIPMDPSFYTNQMQNLFRSYHYRHAGIYGMSGENGASATIEAMETFGFFDNNKLDFRLFSTYYYDTVLDNEGNPVIMQNGEPLTYHPEAIKLDVTGDKYEALAGARMKKYAVDYTSTKDGKLMHNDIVLFRYADVLLMKSEAKVRNGQDGDAEMNAVRSRSDMEYRKATLENLLAERQLELAWEGWRRQDLIRFGQFTRPYSSRPQLPNEANGFTTVFPIPGDVLVLNHNITQNYGYE